MRDSCPIVRIASKQQPDAVILNSAVSEGHHRVDVLSDILSVMRLSGTLYFRTAFTSPFGVAVPAFERVARFHYVHRGRCFAHVGNTNPHVVCLDQGDLVIIPHGEAHVLSAPLDAEPLSVDAVVEQSGFTGRGALVYGEPDPEHETQLICGHFSFDTTASHILLEALPPYIHIKDYGKVSPEWLEETLRIIGEEVNHDGLGSDLVALKLSEIIFTQALRHYLDGDGRHRRGLAGFGDARIRKALEAIHENPAKAWTVDDLASTAGLSRTAFSRRFSELVSHTPLNYLTAWRMQQARQLLIETRLPLIEVATRSGYQSESSFSRVFKKRFDRSPAEFRREHAPKTSAEYARR